MRKVILLYKDVPHVYGEEVFRTNPMTPIEADTMSHNLKLLGCRQIKKVAA